MLYNRLSLSLSFTIALTGDSVNDGKENVRKEKKTYFFFFLYQMEIF